MYCTWFEMINFKVELHVQSTFDTRKFCYSQRSISGTSPWTELGSSKRPFQKQNTHVTRGTKFPYARVQFVISVKYWSMRDCESLAMCSVLSSRWSRRPIENWSLFPFHVSICLIGTFLTKCLLPFWDWRWLCWWDRYIRIEDFDEYRTKWWKKGIQFLAVDTNLKNLYNFQVVLGTSVSRVAQR